MKCTNIKCQAENPDDAHYCHMCGEKITSISDKLLKDIDIAIEQERGRLQCLKHEVNRSYNNIWKEDVDILINQIETSINGLMTRKYEAIAKLNSTSNMVEALSICEKEFKNMEKKFKDAKTKRQNCIDLTLRNNSWLKSDYRHKNLISRRISSSEYKSAIDRLVREREKGIWKKVFISLAVVAGVVGLIMLFVNYWSIIKIILIIILVLILIAIVKS